MSRQLRLSRTIPRFFVCLQFVGAPRGGPSGEKSGGRQGKEFDSEFRLGRARLVGLQPTDSIRGHPRLGAVDAKTWMRGSSPRKTTLTCFLEVPQKCSLRENLSPDSPARDRNFQLRSGQCSHYHGFSVKAVDDPPIRAHRDAPVAGQVVPQRVQTEAGQIQLLRLCGFIELFFTSTVPIASCHSRIAVFDLAPSCGATTLKLPQSHRISALRSGLRARRGDRHGWCVLVADVRSSGRGSWRVGRMVVAARDYNPCENSCCRLAADSNDRYITLNAAL